MTRDNRRLLYAVLLILALSLVACAPPEEAAAPAQEQSKPAGEAAPQQSQEPPKPPTEKTESTATTEPEQETATEQPQPSEESPTKQYTRPLSVHFIDVGQGDAILVLLPNGQNMLIDAGDNGLGPRVVAYLKEQGVTRVDYLVATHPHADHIGGMPEVIEAFEIGKVYMPRTGHTTRIYERLLLAIKEKGLTVIEARTGVVLFDEPELKVRLVGPVPGTYTSLNDYSAVVHLRYRYTAFLFTGDAEAASEGRMIAAGGFWPHKPAEPAGVVLDADVLKVGQHGSRSSTTAAFLEAVSPTIAVISVGADNRYGHPHADTLARLQAAGVTVYRTDLHGTVVITSDGEQLTVEVEKAKSPTAVTTPPPTQQEPFGTSSITVYITKTGSKYHREGCRFLNRLLEAARRTRDYPLIATALGTGMRLGELLALRWEDVDLEAGTISVTRSMQYTKGQGIAFKEPKTPQSRRKIILPPALVKVLRAHKTEQAKAKLLAGQYYAETGLVFDRGDGRPQRSGTVSARFRTLVRRVGLSIRFHDLRHTHASLLLQQGVHPKVVAERLGHSGVSITLDTYSHVVPGLQERAAEQIEAVLRLG